MVHCAATFNHGNLYGALWQHCETFYRRRSTGAFLPLRNNDLELFLRKFNQNLLRIYCQCRYVWQSVFSKAYYAALDCGFFLNEIRSTVSHLYFDIAVLRYFHRYRAPELVDFDHADFNTAHGDVRFGNGDDFFVFNDQVQRPHFLAHFWDSTLHVYYTGGLSRFRLTRKIQILSIYESLIIHFPMFPLCLSGLRKF